MLVTDYPGWEEDAKGIPLVGKTGKEVTRYLNGKELPRREEIRIEPLIREYREDTKAYTEADVERDSFELHDAIGHTNPNTIVTMGRWSARWALGDVDMDEVYAIPWYWGPGRVVFPMYNPAAGFKNPEVQAKVSYGFSQLAAFLAGKLVPRPLYGDAFDGKETYVEITSPDEIVIDPALPIAIDSEGWAKQPWSVQYSQKAGEGWLIRADRADLLEKFRNELRTKPVRIIYHASLHDLGILRVLGIETNDLSFDDTAVMSYLLQTEPAGLKPLAVRHAGMRMQSYDDVLGDAGNRLATDYLVSLYDIEQAEYEARQQAELAIIRSTPLRANDGTIKRLKATGEIRYRKVTKPPSLPKTRLHKAAGRVLGSKRPRALWLDQDEDILVAAYNRLGPMDEPTLDHVAGDVARHYACRDSDATLRVASELRPRIDALGLGEVYGLELSTYPLIDRMGQVGFKPDLPHFAALSGELQGEIDRLQGELVAQTGNADFNANSGDQVATLLFDDLGLPGSKRTAEGRFSTNDKILEALEKEFGSRYPVVSDIREFRETYKLKNTFVDRIPDFVNRYPFDGRVHASFRTTRVVTGRLAASDPNLLAQPKYGKFAKRFREGWVADERHVLASWDQSQIELRILAHLSQDPVLLSAYRDGLDLHAKLAQRIFGGQEADYKKGEKRTAAKAVNFGLPMGMTKFGLAIELRKNGLDVDEDDAQRWIDETDALYVEVPNYKKRMVAEAKQNGFVRCLSGRIRYIGGIWSWDEFIREEAERFAFSTPVQEGAQWVMKQAEAHVWRDIILPYQAQGHYIEPLIQIHDDLILELEHDPAFILQVNKAMRWAMTQAPQQLSVPLDTSGDFGPNWATMEEIGK